jgi:hypothetical protein
MDSLLAARAPDLPPHDAPAAPRAPTPPAPDDGDVAAAHAALTVAYGPAAAGALLPVAVLAHAQAEQPHVGDGVDPRVLAYLTILDEYRLGCEEGGKYAEAGAAVAQLAAVRAAEEARCAAALADAHARERAALADAQAAQHADFTAQWDGFLGAYDDAAGRYMAALAERQAGELKTFQDRAAEEVVRRPFKAGRELLDWRERAESLAR